MKDLITRDRYEDLDPDVAEALRGGRQVHGTDDDGRTCWLCDYEYGCAYPYKILHDSSGVAFVSTSFDPTRQPEEKPNLTPDETTPRDTLCEVWDDEKSVYALRYFSHKNSATGRLSFYIDGYRSDHVDGYTGWDHARIIEYPDGTKPEEE